MRDMLKKHWFFILLLTSLSAFYFWGINKVPFHPDESTQLYMSADFEHIISNPLAMAWEDHKPLTDVFRYRLIDAPLTRYLIGFWSALFSRSPLASDWDWSATWEENQEKGAVPGGLSLLIGRLAIASLFPLGLIMLYRIGLSVDGRWFGILLVFVISLNALILLHTRRAMAEGTLVFGVILTFYALMSAHKRPFITGLALAIAFNAKHSALVLLPIGLLAVCWIPEKKLRNYLQFPANTAKYLAGFGLLTILLNPFLWRQPISAAQQALFLRQDLLKRQVADMKRLAPAHVLESPAQRSAVLAAQVFFAPLYFSELGNYKQNTQLSEELYLQNPSHQLWRSQFPGAIYLSLAVLGMIAMIRELTQVNPEKRRLLILYIFAFFTLAGGNIIMIPLPWQRYSIPVIPSVTIFTGLGIIWITKNSRRILSHGRLFSWLSQVLTQFTADSRMS
jgi:4-amino-4-deoxy-L-arabinose transferase-like glycosyltransferase